MKRKKHNGQILKWTTAIFLAFLFFVGCRKYDSIMPDTNQNYEELKTKFFNINSTTDKEIKKLAADIRKQDSIFKFLPDFVRKNGLPKWDKVIYKTSNHSNVAGRQSSTIRTNSVTSSANISSNTNSSEDQGVFFIPLQSQNSQEVKSYITAYKHNDSLYTYRLYNKDSLNTIQAGSNSTKNNLLNTQAVFGYFEKSINNVDSVNINSPLSATIKNVNISFDTPPSSSSTSGIVTNSMASSSGCTMSITVTIEYSLEIWTDGNSAWIVESVSVTMEIAIDCSGGGGGGGCSCGGSTGGGSTGGGGYYDPSGGGYWWGYGTGWPWYTGGGGYYDPNWNWWWTGGGSGGGYDPDFDPLNYPETSEIIQFENDYRNQMSTQELQIFDNMSRTNQLQYLYNAKYALDKAQQLYPNSVHNGNGDAFRHALFSALNAKVLGVSLAKQLGDAHELIPNNPILENQMDLFNNQAGRDQFVYLQSQGQAGHFFKEGLVISLMQKVQNGELRRLDPLDINDQIIPGVTQLVPTN